VISSFFAISVSPFERLLDSFEFWKFVTVVMQSDWQILI
jgi:hypothetical protein